MQYAAENMDIKVKLTFTKYRDLYSKTEVDNSNTEYKEISAVNQCIIIYNQTKLFE